jgi:hypothetical protein
MATLVRGITDTFTTQIYLRRNILFEFLSTSDSVTYLINHTQSVSNLSDTLTTADVLYQYERTKRGLTELQNLIFTDYLTVVVTSGHHIEKTELFIRTFGPQTKFGFRLMI